MKEKIDLDTSDYQEHLQKMREQYSEADSFTKSLMVTVYPDFTSDRIELEAQHAVILDQYKNLLSSLKSTKAQVLFIGINNIFIQEKDSQDPNDLIDSEKQLPSFLKEMSKSVTVHAVFIDGIISKKEFNSATKYDPIGACQKHHKLAHVPGSHNYTYTAALDWNRNRNLASVHYQP